ncbi:MAG: hypothetical protein RMK91_09040 [Pseudanabaenaceae cyanobacterium SKYGB_i_bin29]|nr:hypothetical protein [Pseudanabaenaceae cyanobacterium SKYG29]MDW8422000.1 hypothetical protein [Pseudanabaenaceae cyanobacterium SKYGB_i_bin29]
MASWLWRIFLASFWLLSTPALAERCQLLPVIGGQGTKQIKEVSPPSLPYIPFLPLAIRNNWNTDFAVPGGKQFRSFTATIIPDRDVTYGIEFYLKYSDETADKFFHKTVELAANKPFTITATPRLKDMPFQVNVLVGGMERAIGSKYSLSVAACW